MKKTAIILIGICILALAGAMTGCNGKLSGSPVNAVLGAVAEASGKNSGHPRSGHRVIVLLGPDFTARSAVLDPLIAEYGLASKAEATATEKVGMLLPMKYPENFTEGKRVRLSMLTDEARSSGTTIVVTVGAPSGTVNELTKIRKTNPDMQIISLFPTEDAFPVEAISDLVIDYSGSGDLLADEKILAISDADLAYLLFGAVLSGEPALVDKPADKPAVATGSTDTPAAVAETVPSPMSKFIGSLDIARRLMKQKSLGTDWKIDCFTDPATNLRCRNHVVISSPAGVAP